MGYRAYFFTLFYIFLPAICLYTSFPPLLSPQPNPSPAFLFFSPSDPPLSSPEIRPRSVPNKTANNNMTMLGKLHATARCNYNMPFFLIYPSICPASNRITPLPPPFPFSLAFCNNQRWRSPPGFYHVSHLNRQNISPGIQPQWAACLLPSISPSRRGALSG